jgi:hypothetical protein
MAYSKLSVILIYIFLSFFLLASPYRKNVVVINSILLFYLSIKMTACKTIRPYPRVSREYLRKQLKPGDLVFTYNIKERAFSRYDLFYIFTNEDIVHAQYVIEYQGKPYVLNSYNTERYNRRRKYFQDEKSIVLIAQKGDILAGLEPLEEFLNAECGTYAYVRVVKTEKKHKVFEESDKEVVKPLVNYKWTHCCKALANYLQHHGLIENTSGMSDFFYYLPDVLMKKLGVVRDMSYQIV